MLLLVAALALGRETRAQPPEGDPYARLAGAPTEVLPERPPPSAADLVRRAAVAASAGALVVTVGEVEDHLAREGAPAADLEARRAAATELLRAALVAEEAERRGLARHPEVRAAEREALVQVLLEEDFSLDRFEAPAALVAATPPTRRAFVRFARTPAEAAALRRRLAAATLDELALEPVAPIPRAPHAGGDLGFVAQTPREGEPELAPALRAALFALEAYGEVSAPVALGPVLGLVVYGGSLGGTEAATDDGTSARWAAREAALDELVAGLRAAHLRDVDVSPIYGARLDPRPPQEAPRTADEAPEPAPGTAIEVSREPLRLGGR
ncbi:MAG: hypothetical protein KF729_14300 [Sandaracinaceae bacterium]|nr:hypothetical protein [Sandaracinaceae bacterium]